MQSFVGRASNGSPLRELFDALGPQLSRHARSTLLTGLATGRGPAVIARQLRDNVGLTMVRAMRISRTETLTAYRRASSEIYRANSDVVVDKLWWASLVGSCASCFELHGSSIGLDGEVYDHPNGACTSVPVTKSWAELGYGEGGDERFSTKPGAEKFAELSADQQRRQLGPGKYAAMQNGEIELRDLVKRTHDPRWGPMYREATLTEARDAAAQRATSEVA